MSPEQPLPGVGIVASTRAALVGVGYFLVWTMFGMAALPLEGALGRAQPIAVGVVVLLGGSYQLTVWKARHLACWEAPAGTALGYGLRLGLHCSCCCAGLMAILLGLGVMSLRVMAAAAAITVQRLAPAGGVAERAVGSVAVGTGLVLIARAVGL